MNNILLILNIVFFLFNHFMDDCIRYNFKEDDFIYQDTIANCSKAVNFPFIDSINYNDERLHEISKEEFLSLELYRIEDYKSVYKYTKLKNYYTEDELKVQLIERFFVEETIHWLIIYDSSNSLISYIETAYDNSEGMLTKKSEIIKPNLIHTYILNVYQDSEKLKKYKINNKGEFREF